MTRKVLSRHRGQAIVVALAAPFAAVINLKTRKVVTTITGVGGGDIAVNPSGTRAYVTDENTDTLDVINTDNNTVMPSIPVGDQPRAVVVNTAGTRAYTGNTIAPYSISVVNLITDTDTSDVTSTNLNRPENLGIAPSGAEVYAANFGASAGGTTVALLDPSNNGAGSVTVGTTPTSVMVNPSGTRAYVVDRDSSSLSIIDTASSRNVGTVSLGFVPIHIAITPDGTRALITGQDPDTDDGEDAVFDLLTDKIVFGPSSLPAANEAAIAPAEQPVPVVKVTTGPSRARASTPADRRAGRSSVTTPTSAMGSGRRAPDRRSPMCTPRPARTRSS